MIVIGAGPGGLVVANGLAKAGKKVLLIDRGNWGGDCTNFGCIPSKALIESAELSALSRMDEVADRLSMYSTYFDRPELINEQLGRYLEVDAEAVRDVCVQVFGADDRVTITYVPRTTEEAAA